MQEQLNQIEVEALESLKNVEHLAEIEALRIKYFGRKGTFTALMKGMGANYPTKSGRLPASVQIQ